MGHISTVSARSDSPSGIAVALYLLGLLALVLGGLLFGFSETSPHQLLATLIGLMGAIFYAAGAVITGHLHRISLQLARIAQRGQG